LSQALRCRGYSTWSPSEIAHLATHSHEYLITAEA
jgi:hypothetical protein